MEVRASDVQEADDKRIVEGRAIVFNQPTTLFKLDDIEYKEMIEPDALNATDFTKCFFKYNHSSNVMAMARVKNGTLTIEVRNDGVYIKASLADTTAGRDLYTLIKRGDIDSMSFAFTSSNEVFDKDEHMWRIKKIDSLYDVAAVDHPAYDNTALYARRREDMEVLTRQVEALELAKKRIGLKINLVKTR
jgi:HK97 family phage prohead protease